MLGSSSMQSTCHSYARRRLTRSTFCRRSLLEWYCTLSLKEYRRIFRPSEEAGQLDNLPRRFAWFRRALKTKFEDEGHGRIFPEAWKVQACLCGAFAGVTRCASNLQHSQGDLNTDAFHLTERI